MYIDVDTAIAVPVNFAPLIDDTDFKSRETGIVYNQAGMDLVWNFVTTAGVTTQTAVTPTTAGLHDWTHTGDGMYTLEIPASTGTINNDTEGTGWFTGICTGVLPWVGPKMIFRAAAINNALIDGGDVLDVSVTEWTGTAVATPTVAGVPEVDVTHMEGGTQTVTDLKDFADSGYDPATNKVQGVVLVDTTTTNTDMRGTDSAATAANLATVDTNVDAILVDTGTTLPGTLTTIDGKIDTVDTVVDSILVDTTNIETDTQDIQTRLPASLVGGLMDSNVGAISADTTAADNLEAMYDGTGYTDDNAPSTQSQISSITNSGSAVSTVADSYTLTTGTQSSGTVTSTEALDGTNHEHTDTAGEMDLYYEFSIGSGSPSSVKVDGYLNGTNDNLEVQGYDWVAAGWVQIGTLAGKVASTNEVNSYDLTTAMVGTGGDLGTVRIRFTDGAFTLTTATLAVDRILLAFNQGQGGYTDGIEVDTSLSNTNTVPNVDGIKGNAVSTWAAALTLSSKTGIKLFHILNGSSITLTGNSDNYTIWGSNWNLACGGQSLDDAYIKGAVVSGTYTSTNPTHFEHCDIGTVTGGPARFNDGSGFSGTFTYGSAGDFDFVDCYSFVPGTGSPTFDFGAVGACNTSIRKWSGGLTLNNLATGDVVTVGDTLGTLTLNGSDATVEVRGTYKALVNNLTGSPTVNTDGAIKGVDVASILTDTGTTIPATLTTIDGKIDTVDTNVDSILVDTGTDIPASISALNDISTADVNAEVVDVLVTDTFAEPSSVPAATSSLKDKISFLFTALRNKTTQTATTFTIRNDADSADIASSTVSDDATTATKGELS